MITADPAPTTDGSAAVVSSSLLAPVPVRALAPICFASAYPAARCARASFEQQGQVAHVKLQHASGAGRAASKAVLARDRGDGRHSGGPTLQCQLSGASAL